MVFIAAEKTMIRGTRLEPVLPNTGKGISYMTVLWVDKVFWEHITVIGYLFHRVRGITLKMILLVERTDRNCITVFDPAV